MMKPADHRLPADRTDARRLDIPRHRTVLGQPQVSSRSVVVREVALEHLSLPRVCHEDNREEVSIG